LRRTVEQAAEFPEGSGQKKALEKRLSRLEQYRLPKPNEKDAQQTEEDGVDYLPGMVPDPQFPEQTASVGPWENQSFWITVTVPARITPEVRLLKIVMSSEDPKTKTKVVLGELSGRIDVRSFTIQPRHEFPVTHWWQPDALFDYYKTEPFSEKWWQMAELYLRDMTAHGSNVIMVPVFHTRREVVQRPPQLLKVQEVSPGKYEFDFSDVDRFIARSLDQISCGARDIARRQFRACP